MGQALDGVVHCEDAQWGCRVVMGRLNRTYEDPGGSSEWSLSLGHFQVGSYRYRSLIEGPYTL